jgi:hypothetical protein
MAPDYFYEPSCVPVPAPVPVPEPEPEPLYLQLWQLPLIVLTCFDPPGAGLCCLECTGGRCLNCVTMCKWGSRRVVGARDPWFVDYALEGS